MSSPQRWRILARSWEGWLSGNGGRVASPTRAHRRWTSTAQEGAKGAKDAKKLSRVKALNDRLPKFLRHYTTPLLSAPVSHLSSFLILHELTAILPLLGLFGLFHYADWLPARFSEGRWVAEGVERYGRYLERKGWVSADDVRGAEGAARAGGEEGATVQRVEQTSTDVEASGAKASPSARVVLEIATAWAVTKAFLPVRIVGCVWATPWFARVVVGPVGRGVARALGRA